MFEHIEGQVRVNVEWLRLLVEALGALIRLAFARNLTLALELQLAADILSTSVAPSWDGIGKLAALRTIGTANDLLSMD